MSTSCNFNFFFASSVPISLVPYRHAILCANILAQAFPFFLRNFFSSHEKVSTFLGKQNRVSPRCSRSGRSDLPIAIFSVPRSLSILATVPTGVTDSNSAGRFAYVVGRAERGRDILISYSGPIAILSLDRPERQTQTKQQ